MKRLLQRIQHHVGTGYAGDSPADDPTGKGIDDEVDIDKTLSGRDIGEARYPQSVRLKLLPSRLASDYAEQPHLTHQALNSAAGHRKGLLVQLGQTLRIPETSKLSS